MHLFLFSILGLIPCVFSSSSSAISSWVPICPDGAKCSTGTVPFLDEERILLSPNVGEVGASQWISLTTFAATSSSMKNTSLKLPSGHFLGLSWSGGAVYDVAGNQLYAFNQSGGDSLSLALAGAATLGPGLLVPSGDARILVTGIVFSRNLFPAQIYQSRDEGRSWQAQMPNVLFRNNASTQGDVSRLTSFSLSPKGEQVWVIPGLTTEGLWATPDRTDQAALFDFTRLRRIDDGSFPSNALLLRNSRTTPSFPTGLAIALTDIGMYISSNGGLSWTPSPFIGSVNDFAFPEDSLPDVQVVAARGGVLSSRDHGVSWVDMSRNLPYDNYSIKAQGRTVVAYGRIGAFLCRYSDCEGSVVGNLSVPNSTMFQSTEFFNTILGHFFMTVNEGEKDFIRRGGAGPGWTETGENFSVWSSLRADAATATCRFYGDPVIGPNSHFYSASSAECRQLLLLQDTTTPDKPRWHGEGYEFKVSLPSTAGECSSGLVPVHRAYNNGVSRLIDSNHRFVVNKDRLTPLLAAGWKYEGIAFCVPSQSN